MSNEDDDWGIYTDDEKNGTITSDDNEDDNNDGDTSGYTYDNSGDSSGNDNNYNNEDTNTYNRSTTLTPSTKGRTQRYRRRLQQQRQNRR